MQNYSLYCNISNIAIRPNNKCVLIPLRKTFYGTYAPSCLPIHGTFSGYGQLLNIVEDDNTKMIEHHYGQSIKDFVTSILYYHIDDNHKKDDVNGVMVVDRQVFDIMTDTYHNNKKQPDGNKFVLEHLGFQLVTSNSTIDPASEYVHHWVSNDFDVYTNNRELRNKDGYYITINDIQNIANIDSSKIELFDQPFPKIWRHFRSDISLMDDWFSSTLGYGYYFKEQVDILHPGNTLGEFQYVIEDTDTRTREEHLQSIGKNIPIPIRPFDDLAQDEKNEFENNRRKDILRAKIKFHFSLTKKYLDNLEVYGDTIANLSIMLSNMHCISKTFEPQVHDITPMYGDYRTYDKLFNKFTEINSQYIGTNYDY